MKVRIIAAIVFVLAGIMVAATMIGGQKADREEYAGYLALARANAEKGIPYVAVQNYRRAISMDASDEEIYKEYLAQAEALSEDYYTTAVKEYVLYFPQSAFAYETLCEYYYDQELYQFVMDTALEAKEKGIATDRVRDYYLECSVMYRIIADGFSEAGLFVGDYAKVKMDDVYGYIDGSGYYNILPKYENASFFLQSYAAVYHEDEWYMINNSGYKVAVTDRPVDYLGVLNNGKVLFAINGQYDYMTSSLVVPEEVRFDDATNFKNGVAAVKKNDKWALMNSNMEMITDYIFEEVLRDEFNSCINNGVIFVKKDGQYYMCNSQGNRIAESAFENAYPFVGNEPAAVCVDGKWGFVDSTGRMIIEPQYEAAKSFNIGLAAVCKDGLWGYIDSNGNLRIDYQFLNCLPFSTNGVTAVCNDDNVWTYIKLLPYIQ